ncbi:hypothetical protein Vadar_002738 [Vaccinium darrowii]|uniref:Uncharacterized protein n=1 Tax=Vaccinium darrowii TaxID=229202 RepID=A0ACB7YIR0_9ERIC|nr:hypothetical protein Vadar_002738 [Vaccinium darrowii]
MAMGTQEYGSSEQSGPTSESLSHPSGSSSVAQHTTQEMEMGDMKKDKSIQEENLKDNQPIRTKNRRGTEKQKVVSHFETLLGSDAEKTYDDNIDGGLTVFCLDDDSFKNFLPNVDPEEGSGAAQLNSRMVKAAWIGTLGVIWEEIGVVALLGNFRKGAGPGGNSLLSLVPACQSLGK